jgi:hypothetical protein
MASSWQVPRRETKKREHGAGDEFASRAVPRKCWSRSSRGDAALNAAVGETSADEVDIGGCHQKVLVREARLAGGGGPSGTVTGNCWPLPSDPVTNTSW